MDYIVAFSQRIRFAQRTCYETGRGQPLGGHVFVRYTCSRVIETDSPRKLEVGRITWKKQKKGDNSVIQKSESGYLHLRHKPWS